MKTRNSAGYSAEFFFFRKKNGTICEIMEFHLQITVRYDKLLIQKIISPME